MSLVTTVAFERPIFQEDTTALLLELARAPAKIKKTNQLFEKARARLESALEPVPDWVVVIGYFARARRLEQALRTAQLRKLVRAREGELTLTENGREYLRKARSERLAFFPEAFPWTPGRHDEHFYGVPATSVIVPDPRERATRSHPPTDQDRASLRMHVARAFAALEPGQFHELDAFTRAACASGGAPLLRGQLPEHVLATVGLRVIPPDALELEQASRLLLRHLIAGPLVHVGGVAIAPVEPASPKAELRTGFAFALTPLGRVYLGLDDVSGLERALAEDAPPREAHAVVQANFEVVLLAPDPCALLELAPFTELAGGGAGDHARTLRLTRASVQTAAGAGLGADAILERLARFSKTAVPENVSRAVREWAQATRRASLVEDGLVLSLEDPESLERVRQALGPRARVSVHALEVQGVSRAELRQRLAKLGIVLS